MRRVAWLVILLLLLCACKEKKVSYSWSNSTIFSAPTYEVDGQSIYAVDKNNLFIVFLDWNTGLVFSKSTDGGVTWDTPVSIPNNPAYGPSQRSIWADNTKQLIYIVYEDSNGIYFIKSTNGGSSFGTAVLIDAAAYSDLYKPQIDVYDGNGQYVYVTYSDTDNTTAQLAYSSDYGATWTVKSIRPNITGSDYTYAVKAITTDIIYVSGDLQVSGESEYIYFAKTTDRGDTWSYTAISDGVWAGLHSAMWVKDSNTIYIVYSEQSFYRTYLAKSTDGGVSFEISLIADSSTYYPSIFSTDNGNTLMVSYYDATNFRLRFAYSIDGGANWTSELADNYQNCGQASSLYAVSDYLFILHNTPGGASLCDYCLRLTKSPIALVSGLYFRSTGTNAGYYTKDSASPSLLTSKDSNGMINAGGSPSPYLDHSSATDYYRKEF